MDNPHIPMEYIERYRALTWVQQIRVLAAVKTGRSLYPLTDEAKALLRDIRKG